MEFWGVEVRVGQSIKVDPGVESLIHLSQACLVDVRKDNEKDTVYLYVNTNNQKLCIAVLSADKFPQTGFDLVFDKEFELSHTSKSGSFHLSGYKSNMSDFFVGATCGFEDVANASLNEAKTGNFAIKERKNEETSEPSRQLKHDSDDSLDSADSSDDEDTPIAMKFVDKEDDSDDEDDSDKSDDEDNSDESDEDNSDESDEDMGNKEAQNKPIQSNKRENDSVQVSVPSKKAKLVTPEKNDAGKVGGHVATPYPSKQLVMASGNPGKSKQQSQKTGEFRCNPCKRTFGSENALHSHSKAKHGQK